MGINALELGWVRSVRVSPKTCEEIKKTAEERLIDAAMFGSLAGATDVVFHPGSYGNNSQKALAIALSRLGEVVDFIHAQVIKICLRPETMGRSALLGSLVDVVNISKKINGVEPCLDFAHLFTRDGNGHLNHREAWVEILEFIQKELSADALQYLHIHLSGIAYTDKGEKEHLSVKDSPLDVKEIFIALKDMNAMGRILCESPLLEEDALYLKDLWESIIL